MRTLFCSLLLGDSIRSFRGHVDVFMGVVCEERSPEALSAGRAARCS
jgi:hypothetical protein